MRQFRLFLFMLCAVMTAQSQGVLAQTSPPWSGEGTSESPYLIQSYDDWKALSDNVAGGESYQGIFFKLTKSIDTQGTQVGTILNPFSGTFDGGNNKLTYNAGSANSQTTVFTDEPAAPFLLLNGATIRHLHTTGKIYTDFGFVAGIAAYIGGATRTTLYDCQSDMFILKNTSNRAPVGGLVALVQDGAAAPLLEKCVFDGEFRFTANYNSGLVGLSYVGGVTFTDCMFAPKWAPQGYNLTGSYTFIRMNDGLAAPVFNNSYCTQYMGEKQGITCVFSEISVPEGVTYEMASEPELQFGGKNYWKSGAWVNLTVPEGTAFDHWGDIVYPGTFISDCFKKNGLHQIKDVAGHINLAIYTDPIPEAETERTLWGVTYRYISRQDYHYYFSDETVAAKGWHFENDLSGGMTGPEDNLLLYNADGDASELTVITGYDESDYNDDGVQIHNDLVGDWRNHTHLAMIAPRAFNNSSALKTLYFKDTDANNYNTLTPFDFEIGNEAFANCPNLTEIKMMQYTTKGTNHWEALNHDQVSSIGYDVFLGSPKAKVSTHRSTFQQYLGSGIWKDYRNRFIIYDATVEDFTVNGVKYHYYRDSQELEALTNSDKQAMLDNHVRIWNADYQQFNASSLLDTKDDATVYYSYVVGVDDSYMDSNDGVMRIYNDPGSYYNYKTLALGRSAIAGNEHVKTIEFYQTNGNSENSFSDLKFVIQNGALAGCKNLKELRLFYYVQDGDDHWENLGPQDVIPGSNIFGIPSSEELKNMTEDQRSAAMVPEGFKILVSPERFQEFLDDPNWLPYAGLIEPVDFEPNGKKQDFTHGGLTYGYMTAPGGILQTSQVVSQDVSWWTAPRIAAEIALIVATAGLWKGASATSSAATVEVAKEAMSASRNIVMANANMITLGATERELGVWASQNAGKTLLEIGCDIVAGYHNYGHLIEDGILTATGKIAANAPVENLFLYAVDIGEGFTRYIAQQKAILAAKNAILDAARIAFLWPTLTGATAAATNTSCVIASQCWGGTGSYNGDALQKGMRANILSNIHQVGLVGGGYVITTPSKNLIYHNYIKSVDDNLTDAVIYAGFDDDGNSTTSNTTVTFGKNAFRNKTNLQTISFHANEGQTSNASVPMILTIPDSAFVGCTGLRELNLMIKDNEGCTRALGPENFVLAGDSIFAGLDSLQFHIVIDEDRKQDFLDNESWAPLKRFFTYGRAVPATPLREYGAAYAYAYERNSIKKENKVNGHLIEHTFVAGMDERDYYGFCQRHQGAVKLCNDIGSYNNYQLDYVAKKAFYGNTMLRTVSFTDLYGQAGFGDVYTGLDVTLQDSCFAYCPGLVNLDLVYMKTDGTNELQPLTPQQVKIGKGVFDGSPARIKMMPQQVSWFEADTTWVKYKDRFMPCIIRKTDEGVYNALESMRYYDPAATGYDQDYWNDYIDLARIAGAGFSWLDGRFEARSDIRSFADFKYFESVGLDYVGDAWFSGCTNLGSIVLPSTIKRIEKWAFSDCTSLKEIEIPASVTDIGAAAFNGSTSLNTIIVRGETPALLSGGYNFDAHDGLKIYVPADKVQAYKSAWSDYAQYIVSDAEYPVVKRITTTGVGQVADKLGLSVVKENDKIKYLIGNYAKYDSLTVSGPLNGDDIGVLRHLMGANAWESLPTDGCLRYLNLWGATLCKDEEHSYNGYGVDEYLEKDNWVGEYMFHNCTALESVVLPASVTEIGENAFQDASGLKRIAVGRNTTTLTRDLLQNLEGIEELVFLTDGFATSESSDPWEASIQTVYTTKGQLGNYMNDPQLGRRISYILSPFEDDNVMWALADKEHYFPSAYIKLDNVEGIFENNTGIETFDDFSAFGKVKSLVSTFAGTTNLKSITIPSSVESIADGAFLNSGVSTIYLSADSVPQLGATAFDYQVSKYGDDFHIYVPKQLCKRYREAWPKYADYINVSKRSYSEDEIITVTVTEPNTLAAALGLTVTETKPWYNFGPLKWINSVRGDYSKVRRLKVVGPISGADLSLLRYLAGFCPWTNTRNFSGCLEYIDLYDAQLKESDYLVAADMFNNPLFTGGNISTTRTLYVDEDDVLPAYSFLQAYNLKTLILPKTCKLVRSRALQQCEALETLVVGDDCEEFNWDALDDDAMLTRLYILSSRKLDISSEFAVWRWMCNNYNPTFDAFYVRPSQYEDYLRDDSYTGSSWQRTNNVSKGVFDDDESFLAFASHAAATEDDLTTIHSVDGWFDNHTGIKDMTLMAYTAVDTLKAADFQKLTQLEKIVLPSTLEVLEDSLFAKSPNLRYVNMLICDSTEIISKVRQEGFAKLGIDSLQTLVYVPANYGTTNGTNIVVGDPGSTLHAKTFRLVDSKDYCVPLPFETEKVENTRTLTGKGKAYSAVLPYDLTLDTSKAKAYVPKDRDGNVLTFTEVSGGQMEAFMPYVIRLVAKKATLHRDEACEIQASTTPLITATHERQMVGYTMRGTLDRIDNKEAVEMGISMLVDGEWVPVPANTEHAYIAPFRAYALESANAGAPLQMQFEDEDGTLTGIDTIRLIDGDGTERYYDLNGRELPGKPSQKGVYIHNGKKVVVK